MKKRLILLCFGIMVSVAGYSPANNTLTIAIKPPISPYQALWQATTFIESSNNPNALNRLENAVGIAQIRPIRLRDYNQRTGKSYSLQDCYNTEISKEIYFYYASKFHPSDLESISKSWNGRGKSNKIYWQKIKKQIKINSK